MQPYDTTAAPLCDCGCGGTPKPGNRFLVGHTGHKWVSGSPRARRPLAARFWEKVRKPDALNDCWIWTANRTNTGYGTIAAGGRMGGPLLAHRVSWELHHGPIPDGMNVLHNCPNGDNPACVNPAHLWLGSQLENQRDMSRKGRAGTQQHPETIRRGSDNNRAKFTEDQIRDIRLRYQNGETIPQLAGAFQVWRQTIRGIVVRQTWQHI